MNSLTGCSSSDPELRRVLASWLKIAGRYSEWWEEKCFWYYSERPALSVFAGAVWNIGGIVLEEFGSPKRARAGSRRKGRGDISFKVSRVAGYDGEAKHVWCHLDEPPEEAIERVQRKLKRAYGDIKKWMSSRNPLAIVFVSFVITGTGENISPLDERRKAAEHNRPTWLPTFLAAFQRHPELHIAWHILPDGDCPGAAIIIKTCGN